MLRKGVPEMNSEPHPPAMSKVLQRSSLLQTRRFAGLIDEYIMGDEKILNAGDGYVDSHDFGAVTSYTGLAVVLTDRKLRLFRSRGIMGPKRPFILDLEAITDVSVSSEGRSRYVVIQFRDPYGSPHLWKFHPRDNSTADLWGLVISRAREEAIGSSAAHRDVRLSAEFDELRKRQED